LDFGRAKVDGSAYNEDMAEGMRADLKLQKPLVNDLSRHGAQTVLTLKMTLIALNSMMIADNGMKRMRKEPLIT
jgi:hypothetical protein